MMPTNDMVDAALHSHPKWIADYDDGPLSVAIAAALAVAPTADGWVLCERWVMRDPHCQGHGLALGNCGEDCPPCSETHRRLLVGPTVENQS